ncbi:hypothetical protein K438DRAFT_1746832 [Mycena galopus ATCC 62051]|nr:hypothetical protein K438DRAFT_1746832 [Mycena galopus ATCC 62051]
MRRLSTSPQAVCTGVFAVESSPNICSDATWSSALPQTPHTHDVSGSTASTFRFLKLDHANNLVQCLACNPYLQTLISLATSTTPHKSIHIEQGPYAAHSLFGVFRLENHREHLAVDISVPVAVPPTPTTEVRQAVGDRTHRHKCEGRSFCGECRDPQSPFDHKPQHL